MLSDGDLAGELAQQRDRILAREEALDELRPAQRGAHLDAQVDRRVGRVPGEVARAGRDDHDLAGAGGLLLGLAGAEGRGPADDLVALLHLGVDVRSGVVTFRAQRADGDVIWLESSLRAVEDALVVVSRDVTARRGAELALAHRALHDPLTGLPNRALFGDRLALALRRRARSGTGTVAVFFLDVDRFKLVNDSLGHDVGDALLLEVAARLESGVRPADTVARLAGDEFTVLCEDVAGELEAVAIAQRVVELFEAPFNVAGREVCVTTSVGVALSSGRGGRAAEALIRDADAAMYRAKERGKARFELFDATLRAHAVRRLELEDDLRRAVRRGELRVHYQP